jgi:hypothetical protein
VTSPQGRKGNRAETEAATLLTDLTGYPVRRKLGAGRTDDVGDLDGIPDHVVQVCDWRDVARAIRVKPIEAETQRGNAAAGYAVTFVRLRGGVWRAVLTPEQFVSYLHATTTEGEHRMTANQPAPDTTRCRVPITHPVAAVIIGRARHDNSDATTPPPPEDPDA